MTNTTTGTTIWMPFYPGDYLKSTITLSTAEHGAYLLLLIQYWCSGQALPDDDTLLARTVRLTPREWRKIRPAIAAYFTVGDGVWRQDRMEKELAQAAANKARLSQRSQTANAARWGRDPTRTPNGALVGSPSSSPSSSQSQGQPPLRGVVPDSYADVERPKKRFFP